jgi:hypothetical protein
MLLMVVLPVAVIGCAAMPALRLDQSGNASKQNCAWRPFQPAFKGRHTQSVPAGFTHHKELFPETAVQTFP